MLVPMAGALAVAAMAGEITSLVSLGGVLVALGIAMRQGIEDASHTGRFSSPGRARALAAHVAAQPVVDVEIEDITGPDPVTYHDLRQYDGSLLIRHNESVKVVQARC